MFHPYIIKKSLYNSAELKTIMIQTVLIANRGEIAVRIIRACKLLNMKTIALFHKEDSYSQHVKIADEAYYLGSGSVDATYLNQQKIIDIALKAEVDAIHPGYGFLSENADFARKVLNNGLIFIGPSPHVLTSLGDKTQARKIAKRVGLPIVEGSEGYITTLEEAKEVIERIGFPIIIKAAFGGGGRGMEIVRSEESLEVALMGCQTISERFFGRREVFIERYIPSPRHVEIQFIADQYGNTIHLYDRECSIQRSHQKVIEEAPSFLSDSERKSLGEKVCALAKELSYVNAGTAEFLWYNGELFFGEVNPRLQVEHPVTEMITGVDIVLEQLKIARGDKLSYSQKDISINGHAIEYRINAEDPLNSYLPQKGSVNQLLVPGGKNVRFDTFIYPSFKVSNVFDSLLGKLIVWGTDRKEAISRAKVALKELTISGIKNNIGLHRAILETKDYQQWTIDTAYLAHSNIKSILEEHEKKKLAAVYTVFNKVKQENQKLPSREEENISPRNRWKEFSKLEQHRHFL